MIISATSPRTAPVRQNKTAFKRDLTQFEIKGFVEQTPTIIAHTFDKIGRKEIRTQDGALRTAFSLAEKHRSNPWVDALVEVLHKQTRD